VKQHTSTVGIHFKVEKIRRRICPSELVLPFQIHRDCNEHLHISLKQVLHQRKILSSSASIMPKVRIWLLAEKQICWSLWNVPSSDMAAFLRQPNLRKSY